jgi:Right handed beta helix region
MVRRFFLACPFLILGLLSLPAAAASAPVYPGCSQPAAKQGARSFFVDPVHGSPHGDGSQTRPWRTLEQVVDDKLFANAPRRDRIVAGANLASVVGAAAGAMGAGDRAGPIHGGDTVYLMSGDHGDVTLQGAFGDKLEGYANDDFITIAAASGQRPVLRQLNIVGGSRWVFRGLTFQSLNTNAAPSLTKDYFLVSILGKHDNIVFDHNHLLSAPDVRAWTLQDWFNQRVSGIKEYKGSCISITNNTIENIGFGIVNQVSSKVLISGNSIDHFADDGIDYSSDDSIISNNTITNSVEDGDGIHRDAMQGQPIPATQIITNVTIKDNTVIRLLDPELRFPGYLQGIDTFDGLWRNVSVTGNVVITDANQGISYYGAHGLEISHNLLLGDSGRVLPCGRLSFDACLHANVAIDASGAPRIVVQHGKDGSPSSDVVISKNIASALDIDISTLRVQTTDNLCPASDRKCLFGYPVNGAKLWASKPGRYPGNNAITDERPSALFMAFDPSRLKYDFHRQKSSGDASKVGPGP